MAKAFSPLTGCGANQFLEQIGHDGEEAFGVCLTYLPVAVTKHQDKSNQKKKEFIEVLVSEGEPMNHHGRGRGSRQA